MKILVVHRQNAVVEEIKLALGHLQPVIRYYSSGLDGLIASRMEKFNLIICSTELPVVTGYELVRSIRTISVNNTTPVIFLADTVDAKAQHLGQALGAAGLFLNKDFSMAFPGFIDDNMSVN